jgi:hypothetical protein
MANKYKFSKVKERVTKRFTQKTVDIIKDKKETMSLKEAKELAKTFGNQIGKESMFIVKGLNCYGPKTLRDYNGKWYDEEDDYYDARGYDRDKFENLFQVQIVYLK